MTHQVATKEDIERERKFRFWTISSVALICSIFLLFLLASFCIFPKTYALTSWRCATLDSEGNISLWPEGTFAAADFFSEGLCPYIDKASVGDWVNFVDILAYTKLPAFGGFIDPSGHKYPLKQWRIIEETRFAEGVAPVQHPKSGLVCFVDSAGSQKITKSFHKARAFSDGLAAACLRNEKDGTETWGYIDHGGGWIMEPKFERAFDFHGGRAFITSPQDPERLDVIDKGGRIIFSDQDGELYHYFCSGGYNPDSLNRWRNRQAQSSIYRELRKKLEIPNTILIPGKCTVPFEVHITAPKNSWLNLIDRDGNVIAPVEFLFPRLSFSNEVLRPTHIGQLRYKMDNIDRASFVSLHGLLNSSTGFRRTDFGSRVVTAAGPFVNCRAIVKTCIPVELKENIREYNGGRHNLFD